MHLSVDFAKVQTEDRVVAGSVTAVIVTLILLLLFLFKIIPPDPPFEPSLKSGIEVDFGTLRLLYGGVCVVSAETGGVGPRREYRCHRNLSKHSSLPYSNLSMPTFCCM